MDKKNNKVVEKKKAGRKAWQPTDAQILIAKQMLESGTPAKAIAESFGVALASFLKVFPSQTGAGHPYHVPTDKLRAMVEQLAGYKITKKEIANLVDVSEDTLNKYYEFELARGLSAQHAKLSVVAFNLAESGDKDMLKFILSRKYNWQETKGIELSGKDGGAIQFEDSKRNLLDKIKAIQNLSDESNTEE